MLFSLDDVDALRRGGWASGDRVGVTLQPRAATKAMAKFGVD